MTVCDSDRLFRIVPGVRERIANCPLPGRYLWEYIGYTYQQEELLSTTVYFHEPEWLPSGESQRQREEVVACLKDILGPSFRDEVFMPEGKLIRIDPSFKSSEDGYMLRLELLYRPTSKSKNKSFLLALLMLVCGDVGSSALDALLSGEPLPYHTALTFDRKQYCFVALKVYTKSTTAKPLFRGTTISSKGDPIVSKCYYSFDDRDLPLLPRCVDIKADNRLVPTYIAREDVCGKSRMKVYLFNQNWNEGHYANQR